MSTRLFYVDDSGSEQTGIAVYGWVELAVPDWNGVLRGWLDFRHELYSTLGIPADYELHATKFVGGRGRPTGTAWDEVKSHRAVVMGQALRVLAWLPGLSVGAVYRPTPPGTKYYLSKAHAYAELIRRLDARLGADHEHGLLIMDGDGTDPTYRLAHRELKLDTRQLIEDPLFEGSHHSQWVQMADLVAYTAYMHLARIPTKERTWGWWRDFLAAAAVTGPNPQNLHDPQ
ncbi:DUF3800 domain-containing protein [Allosaccharopolyspora coralli]|uniref:DUF3800 domain-containing protein n=1 Tax=Allosaccharopolyspora coralli TaxID=2665642 RepID=A0A5Q3QA28_9PSEU|nr:DUF3800 domain-containing protein [Allosaccharopolyspora coralli]QGK71418.1 DUF3800 domain-containing protein [Allosaccharopolyspora coralli]